MPALQAKIKALLSDRANLFVVRIFLIYAIWKVIHHLVLTNGGPLAAQWKVPMYYMGNAYAIATSWFLNLFNENTSVEGISIVYNATIRKVRVEEHCLAIPAMIIFTFTIAFFSGRWQNKLWFIPLGLAAIVLINEIRLIFVCVAFEHFSTTLFKLNHSLIYVVITYSFIFMMIAWWMNSFNKDENNVAA